MRRPSNRTVFLVSVGLLATGVGAVSLILLVIT